MVPIDLVLRGRVRRLHLKLEGLNPCGSLKDRTAIWLLRSLEERGRLRPDTVIIESTSGNLGVALAWLASQRGYRFVAVIDPKTTSENVARLKMFGAELELVTEPDSSGGYLLSRLARVRELCRGSDRFVWTDQYANPANPLAHYLSTAPEINAQLAGRVEVLFVPVSTGGTLAGIGRYFRQVSPETRIVAVDAEGSIALGGEPRPRQLIGVGASRRSSFLTPYLYDQLTYVSDAEAFAFCRALFSSTGIKAGGSSGCVLVAASRYLTLHPEADRVVCICADRGDRYDSTIFDDGWLSERGFDITEPAVQMELASAAGTRSGSGPP